MKKMPLSPLWYHIRYYNTGTVYTRESKSGLRTGEAVGADKGRAHGEKYELPEVIFLTGILD
jgi:hypothetical protein